MDEVAYLDQLDARRRRSAARRLRRPPTSGSPPKGPGRPASSSPGETAIEPGPRDRPRRPRRDRDAPRLGPPHRRRLPHGSTAGSATPRSTGSSSTSATASPVRPERSRSCSAWPAGSSIPYSQTNYAAATAGVALSPPVDRAAARRRHLGGRSSPTPAIPPGLPRLTTLDLTGKLDRPALRAPAHGPTWNATGTRRSSPSATARPSRAPRRRRCPVARAALGYRGYTREVSPDGRQPLALRLRLRRPRPARPDGGPADPPRRRRRAAPGRRRPALPRRARRRGPARIRRRRACPPCPRAGPAATSSAPSATARTPTRSPPTSDTVEPAPLARDARLPVPAQVQCPSPG